LKPIHNVSLLIEPDRGTCTPDYPLLEGSKEAKGEPGKKVKEVKKKGLNKIRGEKDKNGKMLKTKVK